MHEWIFGHGNAEQRQGAVVVVVVVVAIGARGSSGHWATRGGGKFLHVTRLVDILQGLLDLRLIHVDVFDGSGCGQAKPSRVRNSLSVPQSELWLIFIGLPAARTLLFSPI